ncbi:hypothetical protein UR09_06350 [Candidatus Nitromaritima sp. SCGC AAA799-A02]|nr:hypothetical protein UR09_06350 [Candidatus Nitromaritima sp. SCGC AAA799-A02]
MVLGVTDFDFVKQLVHKQSGIFLESGKEYLVEGRLLPLALSEGFDGLPALMDALRRDNSPNLIQKVLEAITTKETSFFRDKHPFETLRRSVLPEILEKRASIKELNIWCGAASSGQEPYSIAMVMMDEIPQIESWKINFLATDISDEMLSQCRKGLYSQNEIKRGLPGPFLPKFFRRVEGNWQINAPLRELINFKKLNLCGDWFHMPQWDIIFLRNVLVYFESDSKEVIYRRLQSKLKPDGYLFLGAGETPTRFSDNFKQTEFNASRCYQLRDS